MMEKNIRRTLLFLVLAATFGMKSARADLIISAPTFTAVPGSGSGFDVLLTNNATTPVSIGGFSFEIAVPFSLFAGATTQTTSAPYIYAGNSFVTVNGVPFATTNTFDLIASDTPNNGIAPTLLPGMTVSLGQVLDRPISANIPGGRYTIAFQTPATALADGSGNPLPFTTVNGTIEVAPEPDYLWLVVISLGLIGFVKITGHAKRIIR